MGRITAGSCGGAVALTERSSPAPEKSRKSHVLGVFTHSHSFGRLRPCLAAQNAPPWLRQLYLARVQGSEGNIWEWLSSFKLHTEPSPEFPASAILVAVCNSDLKAPGQLKRSLQTRKNLEP